MTLPADVYARVYGPTTGDRIRLGDTHLWVEVEHDDQERGNEVLAGFAKTARDGLMAQATTAAVEIAITQVVVVDPILGVRKTTIGISGGRIVALGRAGNPDIMDGVEVVLGTDTAIVSGEGLIATAGAIDSHVHLLSPQIIPQALAAGFTTLVIQDYGPVWNLGTNPIWALQHIYAALDQSPINTLMLTRGSSSRPEPLERMLRAGAGGLKIHEDVGAHASALEMALRVADHHDVQLCVHTDGLNECLSVEDTLALVAGRTLHAYHIEGTGGGHAPDVLRLAGQPNILTSSTNPTFPFGINTAAEHTAMIEAVHVLQDDLPGDHQLALDRVRPATMAAEDVLHDLGLIHMTSSDSQGMGRIGETLRRTFQLASVMRDARGGDASGHDNERVLRYLAKATINPAIAHGMADHVGSLEVGKLADIVLWSPAWFAVKPFLVLKAGFPTWGMSGDPNASTAFSEPTRIAAQIGALGTAPARLSLAFTSQAAVDGGAAALLPTAKQCVAVRGTRTLGAADMVRNTMTAAVRVDPTTHAVSVDGVIVDTPPVATVPLSALHLLG
ncbi:MAG: urease subunit alpha [Thermoleophilia bacterium]|nr:urease subunit alpha [Thermoleophilia bacterium]